MSLEERLSALTDALNRNSDLLEGLTAKANAKVSADAAPTKGKATDEPKGKDKDDAKGGDEKPARGRGGKAKAEKAPTVAEMKKEAEAYLDVEDESEYNDRRAIVRAIADYFEAPKFTEIEAKDRLLAVKILRAAANGDQVDPEDIQAAVDEIEGGSGEDDADSKKGRRNDDV